MLELLSDWPEERTEQNRCQVRHGESEGRDQTVKSREWLFTYQWNQPNVTILIFSLKSTVMHMDDRRSLDVGSRFSSAAVSHISPTFLLSILSFQAWFNLWRRPLWCTCLLRCPKWPVGCLQVVERSEFSRHYHRPLVPQSDHLHEPLINDHCCNCNLA